MVTPNRLFWDNFCGHFSALGKTFSGPILLLVCSAWIPIYENINGWGTWISSFQKIGHKVDPIDTFCQSFIHYVEHRWLFFGLFSNRFAQFFLMTMEHAKFEHISPLKVNFYYVNVVFIGEKLKNKVDRVNFVPLFVQTELSCVKSSRIYVNGRSK